MDKTRLFTLIGAVLFSASLLYFIIYKAQARIQEAEEKARAEVSESAKKLIREEAVMSGVARWVSDEKGKPKFEWIIPKERN